MIIDFKELEKRIVAVETVLIDLKLDEKMVVLDHVKSRVQDTINKTKMNDAVGNMPLGSLMKRAFGAAKNRDEDGN